MKKLVIVLLAAILGLTACQKTETQEFTIESIEEETEGISTVDTSDRLAYIPVTVSGEVKNLYDLIGSDSLVYLKRDDCKDCIRDGEMILETLNGLGMPYLIIDVSKENDGSHDIWLESAVAKEIGIKEIPSVCFIRDGKFISHIDNAFTDGSEILEKAEKTYSNE